uniref:Ovule protein n=1 Tax=Mesocestoides corti TaxID=53468 RepID=A0A5K3FD63_MESCO
MKKTRTIKLALLSNYKSESYLRLRLPQSTTMGLPFIIYCFSYVSISGWLDIFLACHANAKRQKIC